MTDEKKPADEVEETIQPTPQLSEQQNMPANTKPASKSAIELEAERLQTAVTHKADRSTEKLKASDLAGLPQALPLSFGGEPGSAKWFRRLPVSMSTSELPPETPRWRVELIGLAPTVEPMGLEVVGDTVIGRGRVGTEPADLDLDMYGALEKGVSRRHGLFRPTANHLYIIDLGSTNGTLHNGIPLGPGVARALKHNDTITLGRFSFTIKIVDGPAIRRPVEPEHSVVAPSIEDAEQTQPLKVMDAAEVRARKTKLAPPILDPSSPETTKLPAGEADKNPPQLSAGATHVPPAEVKPSVTVAEPLTPPAGSPKVEGQLEVKPPVSEAKPPMAESKGPTSEAKPPAGEVQPPATDSKAPAGETQSPVDETKPSANEEASSTDKQEPKKRASLLGE
jgi:pSer/pThr/pTyr-binding forkhead associated (FHA) protein